MDEAHTVGVNGELLVPSALDEMIVATEQLSKDLPACWHWDLITSEWLPVSDRGVVYVCARCSKPFNVPRSLIGEGKPPERLSINPMGEIII